MTKEKMFALWDGAKQKDASKERDAAAVRPVGIRYTMVLPLSRGEREYKNFHLARGDRGGNRPRMCVGCRRENTNRCGGR